FLLTLNRESADRCFLYACYGNPIVHVLACLAEGFRHYIHQVMATFGPTGKEVVMAVDRSGIHRAHTLASTLAHWQARFRLQFLPARCGHHLNPIEGFWRVLKDKIGASVVVDGRFAVGVLWYGQALPLHPRVEHPEDEVKDPIIAPC